MLKRIYQWLDKLTAPQGLPASAPKGEDWLVEWNRLREEHFAQSISDWKIDRTVEKPRIRKISGTYTWMCKGSGENGFGASPIDAYFNWISMCGLTRWVTLGNVERRE